MAFDETLADRIRDSLASRKDVREVKMMGGLCFMVGGHMAIGIVGDELMVRVGQTRTSAHSPGRTLERWTSQVDRRRASSSWTRRGSGQGDRWSLGSR